MFDQVAREYVDEAFGDQAQEGAQEVLAGGDPAQGEAEVNKVGGDHIDGAAEDHRPHAVFLDALVDPPDEFLFSILLLKRGSEDISHHVPCSHYSQQIHSHGNQEGGCKIQQKSQGQGQVEYG